MRNVSLKLYGFNSKLVLFYLFFLSVGPSIFNPPSGLRCSSSTNNHLEIVFLFSQPFHLLILFITLFLLCLSWAAQTQKKKTDFYQTYCLRYIRRALSFLLVSVTHSAFLNCLLLSSQDCSPLQTEHSS